VQAPYNPLVPSPPLREQVYFALEELILEGYLPPGHRLVESDLATHLQVSRGPIREALQLLERDGWIEVRPRRGAYVRIPSEAELDDFFRARNLLETEAARLAARRVRRDPGGAAGTIEHLSQALERSASLSQELPDELSSTDTALPALDGSRRHYRETSRNFHRTIVLLSGNTALADMLEYVMRRTRWWFASTAAVHRNSRRDEHHHLLDAIMKGDEDLAAEAMHYHLDQLRLASLQALRRERDRLTTDDG
jgi:DNA-binding GntR family transcriptional regulator